MNFTAKFNGQPPAAQTQNVAFTDCDTNTATDDAPGTLNIVPSAAWITASRTAPTVVTVQVNQSGLAAGSYSGTVNITIPDPETCEIGKVFAIPVTMTVQKGKVKFR